MRKTGAHTPLNREVLGHVATWLGYFLAVRAVALFRRGGPAIWFSPEVPRPWYMIRSVAAWAGVRVVADPAHAAVGFHFDDSSASPPAAPSRLHVLNGNCLDIGKSRVNRVFAESFGYELGLNPLRHHGPAVEKSEGNGFHDGRLVSCPTAPVPGRCYQRWIDTEIGGRIQDLRTACVGGIPVVVTVKSRDPKDRFASGANMSARTRDPAELFSPQELAAITKFNAAMGLDWGTLDILRDRADGRIYIVDVNKTDVGPVLQLPFAQKIASTRALSRALKALIVQSSAPCRSGSTTRTPPRLRAISSPAE